MKTIMAILIIILSTEVAAGERHRNYSHSSHQHRSHHEHGRHHHHARSNNVWYAVGGAVVGSILVNAFNQRPIQYTDTYALEYERGRLDRQRQEAEMARRRAYECGYSGRC